jgi:hypothetical protein
MDWACSAWGNEKYIQISAGKSEDLGGDGWIKFA